MDVSTRKDSNKLKILSQADVISKVKECRHVGLNSGFSVESL
jgi:hypothetical protein